jgi:hypothetical protein
MSLGPRPGIATHSRRSCSDGKVFAGVAILTTLNCREPMETFIERLRTADVATGKPRRLSE